MSSRPEHCRLSLQPDSRSIFCISTAAAQFMHLLENDNIFLFLKNFNERIHCNCGITRTFATQQDTVMHTGVGTGPADPSAAGPII